MRRLRWQLIIIFLTGLVVGILLLGEQPVVSPLQTPEPIRGGIYSEALVGSLERLNPVLDFNNPVDHDIDRLIFNGLVRFDSRGVPQPDLAESWGISEDGTIYNFSLRQNIKWHDGEALTSDDVLFTVDFLRNGGEYIPEDIQAFWKEVEVVNSPQDPNTLQFRLPEPFAPFLDYLTFGILPRHLLDGLSIDDLVNDPFNLHPIGTGPYRFDRLIVENGQIIGVILKSFDGYFGKPAFIDQLVFRYYTDSVSAFEAYQEGTVQGIGQVTSDILAQVLAQPGLSVYTGREPKLSIIFLNLKNPQLPFFSDPKVRNALLMGLNRQRMINQLIQGQAIIANGPILPGTWAYYNNLKSIPYDKEAAIQLLKDSGYVLSGEDQTVRKKENTELSFKLSYPDTDFHRGLAEAIQRDWEALNIQVELEPVPYDQLITTRLAPRSYDAVLIDINFSRTPDPDPYPFWDQSQATGGQNYSQWDNRLASEYLEQARITLDITDRERLYRNFQVIFKDELPALPLYFPVYSYAVSSEVQGVQLGPLFDTSDRFLTVANWYLMATRNKPAALQPSATSTVSTTSQP